MSTLIGNKKQRKSRVWLAAGRHAGPSREGPAVTARAQAGTPAHGGGQKPSQRAERREHLARRVEEA